MNNPEDIETSCKNETASVHLPDSDASVAANRSSKVLLDATMTHYDAQADRLSSPNIPEFIGDYRILNLLAVQGQGAVYRADHPHLNRQVVIKVSKNQLDESHQQVVVEEGRALATLSHPNLAQVYDLQFQDGRPFLVMEYIEGRNLAECLKDTQYSPTEAANLVGTLAEAIQHAHDVGVIHRDLKPANVVIRAADKTAKIIDFGLASTRTAYADDSLNTTYGGTIAYMAPEQAQQLLARHNGEAEPSVDHRIDVFALGAILYQLTTGRRLYKFDKPLEGLQLAAGCEFDPSPLDQAPSRLNNICRKALAKEPSQRWSSAAELAEALRAFATEKSSLSRLPIAAVAVLGVLVFGAVIWSAIGQLGQLMLKPDSQTNAINSRVDSTPTDNLVAATAGSSIADQLLPGATFTHFMNKSETRSAGRLFENGPVREDDDLRIEVQFATPVYCFLFAINPDGAVQLCYPHPDPETYAESRDEIQSEAISNLEYPADENQGFAFTDGEGQQAFILVRSQQPLPSFNDWLANASNLKVALQTSGQWIFNEGTISPWISAEGTRGAPRKLRGSEPFEKVMNALQAANQDCEVSGLSFPVVSK